MQFIYLESSRVGINLDRVESYSLSESRDMLTIKMAKQQFFINDKDEISYFLDVVMLMESEE